MSSTICLRGANLRQHSRRERFADPPGWSAAGREAAVTGAKRLNQGAAGLWLLSSLAFILFLAIDFSPAQAQTAVFSRGDAVETGFSGIKPAEAPLPPGANPLDEFFIDLEGASAQIQSLATLGQPPQGQLVTAPSKLSIKARQCGSA
jgi:hypothetical protein